MGHAHDVIGQLGGAQRVIVAMQASPSVFVGASGGGRKTTDRVLPLRVDTEDTYRDFMQKRAVDSPNLPALAKAVAELRQALSEHMSDGHGPEVDDVLDLAGDVSRLRDAVVLGELVPLSVEPIAKRHVRCWRDGDVLCCSLRVRGADDMPRILTACSPVADAVSEVLGYADIAGVDVIQGLAYLPTVGFMAGGGKLFKRLAKASQDPQTRCCPCPCTAKVDASGKVVWL